MQPIAFPAPRFRTRPAPQGTEIFDPVRRRWVALTPEEWVRQNLLAYMTQIAGYPPKLIAVERGIGVGELRRRFDIVAFRPDGSAWLLAECKADTEPLGPSAVSQLLAYQSALQARFLVVTNGVEATGVELTSSGPVPLTRFPDWARI